MALDCLEDVNPEDSSVTLDGGGSEPWQTGPAQLVTDSFGLSRSYADVAFSNTWCFLQALADYSPTLNDVESNVQFTDIDSNDLEFQKPVEPIAPAIDLVFPKFPDAFVPGPIYEFNSDNVGELPIFDQVAPSVALPASPGDLTVSAPTDSPEITTKFTFPEEVSYTLPTIPTFESLSIPDAPTVSVPEFSAVLPSFSVSAPTDQFSFNEVTYDSDLLAALKGELLDRIQNGGTGLSPTIEQAIWDRARNREDVNSVRSENEINIEQAAKGWSRPTGAHLAALDQLAQETQNKNADLSREIAIQQAQLEQKNLEFAIQTSLALESSLIQHDNNVQNRALDSEKFVSSFAIELFNAQVSQFNVELGVYTAYSQAFESRVRAELTNVEIYKAQIEGEMAKGEVNQQYIDLYRAQLDGIKTSVSLYSEEISAINTRIQAESLKLANFKSEVDIFATQVEAKRSEYSMYSEAVKGEMAKVDIFDSQVKAFVSRIEAYSKSVDAESSRSNASIEQEGFRLKEYLSKIQASVEETKAKSAEIDAQVGIYEGQSRMYAAETVAESSRIDANGKAYSLEIEKNRYAAEVELRNAEILVENARNSVGLVIESLKSGANVGASLAAASLSAINVGAQVSGSSADYHNYDHT